MSRLAKLTDWHNATAKAFITQNSGGGEYYIKMKFASLDEVHSAYDAMVGLAKVAAPIANTTEQKGE